MMFATSSFLPRRLPGGPGREVTLDIDLQLNIIEGVYTIETTVFDRKRGKLIAEGPWVNVTVHEEKSFVGEVQMNPEMVLRSTKRRTTCWCPVLGRLSSRLGNGRSFSCEHSPLWLVAAFPRASPERWWSRPGGGAMPSGSSAKIVMTPQSAAAANHTHADPHGPTHDGAAQKPRAGRRDPFEP